MTDENRAKKEYLRSYAVLNLQIQGLEAERARILSQATGMTANLSGMPKGGGSDKIQHGVDRLCEIADRSNGMIDELVDLKQAIEQNISEIGDIRLAYILRARYLWRHSLTRVAEDLNYSFAQIKRLHGHALQRFKR